MAYIDVLAGTSYGRYNLKLAKLTNLQTAVYWSCVLNVISAVVRKKTYNDEGYFKIDRKYVLEQTTLQPEEQELCDKALEQLQVVSVDPQDKNHIRVDVERMAVLLISDEQTVLKSITKAAKVSKADKAASKKEGIINRLKARVNEPDPELYELYGKLIEVCYPKGMTQNAQIDLFQQELNNYTADKKVKTEILTISISRGYKVFDWSKSIYEKTNHKVDTATRPAGEQKVCTGLDDTIEF